MEEKKYLKAGIIFVMFITLAVTVYALYINAASSRHVALMAEADYISVIGEKAAYIDAYPEIKDLNVYAEPKWMIDVQAQIEGVISEIYVKKGDFVKKGQVIAKIDNIDLPAQSAQIDGLIFQSRARLLESEKNLSRYEDLLKSGGISLQQYDDALSSRDVALGELNANLAQKEQVLVKKSKTVVTAPEDSEVINVYREKGYYIKSGEALILLGDLSEFVVKVDFATEDLEKLLPLEGLFTLSTKEALMRYKVYPIPFKSNQKENSENYQDIILELANIYPPLEINSKFHSVIWRIKESGGLLEPTTYQDSSIVFRTPRRVLAVPKTALHYEGNTPYLHKGDMPYLYIVDQQNKLEIRQAKTGVQSKNHVEILDGVKEGETVVISAKQGLYSNLKVKVSYARPKDGKKAGE